MKRKPLTFSDPWIRTLDELLTEDADAPAYEIELLTPDPGPTRIDASSAAAIPSLPRRRWSEAKATLNQNPQHGRKAI